MPKVGPFGKRIFRARQCKLDFSNVAPSLDLAFAVGPEITRRSDPRVSVCYCGLERVFWRKCCRYKSKNEGTKLPTVMESTKLIKNKAGFSNVAPSLDLAFAVGPEITRRSDPRVSISYCGLEQVFLEKVLWIQIKNEGTKLPTVMESTKLIKNKAGFGNVASSLRSAFRGRARVRSPLKPRRQHLLLRFGTSLSGENVVNTNQKMKEQTCQL